MSESTLNGGVDVVVVGAGLAGLSAARKLRQAGKSVRVLEARGEVGGRTRSREIDGAVVDFGGEWIGRAHTAMCGLVTELGLHVEPARQIGYRVLWRLPGGQACRRLPPRRTLLDMVRVLIRAGSDSRRVDPGAPWSASGAEGLDAVSVADWLDRSGLDRDSRYLFERLIGSLTSQHLHAMSTLHLLWLLRMAGDPLRTLATTFQWRITEGAQQVSARIAGELGEESIQLCSPVREIRQRDDGTAVIGDNFCVHARRTIVATPVPMVATIRFDPPLPAALERLSQLHLGAGTKVIARLPRGHRVRHNTVVGGPRLWGAWRRGDTVTGFVPPMAGEVPDADLIEDLAAAFEVNRASDFESATVFRWAQQEYINGCDAAFAPGQVLEFGPQLNLPHGLVRFASVARSSWPDNMEGAVRSGQRAADEILATL
jgi:monoamine oxidase